MTRSRSTRTRPNSSVEAPTRAVDTLHGIVRWYFREVFARFEGPGVLPFYCDPARVGHFAVDEDSLAAGRPAALFRLFIAMSMFQARTDARIMAQQLATPRIAANSLSSQVVLRRRVTDGACDTLATAESFDIGCSVAKVGDKIDCSRHPGAPCHVKDGTRALRRMGDMGKLPTSAWLHLGAQLQDGRLLAEAMARTADPFRRAELLVARFSRVYRVGEKLATMYVSALSTPALAPVATPWFPQVDGNKLVIVDTNVARIVDQLRRQRGPKTYSARARWLSTAAAGIDLKRLHATVPRSSPRLVQQALYSFGSKSNRMLRGDTCDADRCPAPALCPFCESPQDGQLS